MLLELLLLLQVIYSILKSAVAELFLQLAAITAAVQQEQLEHLVHLAAVAEDALMYD